MSEDTIARSIGHHGHWGFSAGFDFLEALASDEIAIDLDQACGRNDSMEPINILLMQPGDIRHILFTVARRRRHGRKQLPPINFYLYENPIQLLTRDILFLEMLNDYEMPIRQRSNVFLEVFGNNKLQKRTNEYVDKLGKELRRFSASGKGRLDHVLDLSMLNYRERDEFEAALNAYSISTPFDMDSFYDHRQRGFYAERFDSRKALFDWDYQSAIREKASIVHIKQYKHWRQTGIAFEFGDQTYTEPNRTLMTYTEGFMKKGKEKGMKKEVKGFWGDIVASPYFALGVDCDTPNKFAEGLFEIQNKGTGTEQHRHHAVEIALYNMYSLLWEIETGQVYRMTRGNDIYSGLGQLDRKVAESEGEEGAAAAAAEKEKQDKDALLPIIETVDDNDDDSDDNGIDTEGDKSCTAATEQKEDALHPPLPPPPPASISATTGSNFSTTDAKKEQEKEKRKNQEAAIAKALHRAETIVESYRDIKVIPLTGSLSSLLSKKNLQGRFDAAFVSSRAAQALGEKNFKDLFRTSEKGLKPVSGTGQSRTDSGSGSGNSAGISHSGSCLLAVETGKFVVPLGKAIQADLTKKEEELATQAGFKRLQRPPVPRRHRDEKDLEDDVIFFQYGG